MGKGLLNKLKLGFAAAGIAGLSYFNSLNAQPSEKNYISKYNTTTHYIIKEIQKENSLTSLKTLDEIINESKKIVKENYKNDPYNTKNSQKLMEKIGELVEKEFPLFMESHPCYKRSLTYLAIAEENKLPLYPVMIPSHIFVRWDPDGIHKQWGYNHYSKGEQIILDEAKDYLTLEGNSKSNEGDFNWDPTFLKSLEDIWYEWFFVCGGIKFSSTEVNEGIYLKNLNKQELLSYVYAEESIHSMINSKYDKALVLADKSLELNPKNILAYDTKGNILYSLGKNCKEGCEKYFEEAIENFEKANKFTHHWSIFKPEYYSKIGWALKSLGKYEEAEKNFNKAIFYNKQDVDENIKKGNYEKGQKEFLLERLRFYLITNQNEKTKKDLIIYSNLEGLKITEHDGKTIYVRPNELRGQLSNWEYAKEKCKNLDTLDYVGGEWRLPSIEELGSIYKTKELTNLEYKNNLLWSSTKDTLSEKKMLVKDLGAEKNYSVSKNIDYLLFGSSKIQINSVCIKTIEEWNIDEMLAEQKKKLIEEDYPKILYEFFY